jgi:hypothetical protein
MRKHLLWLRDCECSLPPIVYTFSVLIFIFSFLKIFLVRGRVLLWCVVVNLKLLLMLSTFLGIPIEN